MKEKIKEKVGTAIYRLMEFVDGEKGFKIISYRIAQPVKMFALTFIG